LTTCTCT